MNHFVLRLTLACSLWAAASAPASTIAEIAALPEGGHATADTVIILPTTDLVDEAGTGDVRSVTVQDPVAIHTLPARFLRLNVRSP